MIKEWILGLPSIQHWIVYWGYPIAFIAALLEAVPAVGLVIPGQTIIFILGFLAQQQLISITALVVCAALGAIAGDAIGFYLGRKYGYSIFRKQRGMVDDARALLHEHPMKTLILGRFNSITRAFAPFAAGASKVPTRKFMVANIIGGILWASVWTLFGFLFGASYDIASRAVEATVLGTLIVVGILFFAYRRFKHRYGLSHRAFTLTATSILSVLIFGFTLAEFGNPLLSGVDAAVASVTPLTQPFAVVFALTMSALFDPIITALFIAIISSSLFITKRRRAGTLFLVSAVGAIALSTVIKTLVHRVRPLHADVWSTTFLGNASWSFPSGHATIAVAFFAALALLGNELLERRRLFQALCLLAATLVCLSRLMLGVHYVSDVIGGAALGMLWISLVFLVDEIIRARSIILAQQAAGKKGARQIVRKNRSRAAR